MENEEGKSENKNVENEGMRKIGGEEEKKDENENEMKNNVELQKEKEERKKRGREYERVFYNPKKHHFYPMTFNRDFLKTTNAVFDVGKSVSDLAILGDLMSHYVPSCKEASLEGDMTLSLSTLFEDGGATDVLKPP
ncbi:unnamed protein product [Amaranthus hypochondriacus]